MGYRTTRPQGALRACRIRSYVAALAVLAGLAGAPALAQTGTAQVDRVIDGDTITVRLDSDPAGDAQDGDGRILRYVMLASGENFNATLIRTGYGTAIRTLRETTAARPERRTRPMPNDITQATALSAKASKSLDTMRARIVKADDARTKTWHTARAAQVAETAAATANRAAADAWDALATHAAKHADDCRHGAELADRTRHRWARSV